MKNILIIGFGGFFGTIFRYLTYEVYYILIKNYKFPIYLNRINISKSFPFPTLICNVLGSFLAGFILYYFTNINIDSKIKNFILVGFLGGFTTFSAFSVDFLRLVKSNNMNIAIIYASLSLILSLLSVFAGFSFLNLFR